MITSERYIHFIVFIFFLFLAQSEAMKSISLVFMLFALVYALFTNRAKITLDLTNASIIIHFLTVVLGIFIGINTQESFQQYSDVLKILVVFLFFREVNLGHIGLSRLLYYMFSGFVIAILIGYFEFLFGESSRLSLRSVGSVNRSAVYIIIAFAFAFALLTNLQSKFLSSRVVVASFLLAILGVFVGASRMAIFSLPIVFFLERFLSKKISVKYVFFLCISVIFLLAFVFIFLQDTLLYRKILAGLNDTPRVQIWTASILFYVEHANLLFGIGVGNSIFINIADYFGSDTIANYLDNTHNLYLDFLLERGIIGLGSFLFFFYSIYAALRDKLDNPLNMGVVLSIFSVLVMGLANITFRYEFALLLVALAGISLNKTVNNQPKKPTY